MFKYLFNKKNLKINDEIIFYNSLIKMKWKISNMSGSWRERRLASNGLGVT